MTASESAWSWVLDASDGALFSLAGCLTFVRGRSAWQVFDGFGIDPRTAREMTHDQLCADPLFVDAGFDAGPFWVRVAEVGDWAVGIEYLQLRGWLGNIGCKLSRGTEAVTVARTIKGPGTINYFRDREWVTSFRIGEGYDTRAGVRPDHFYDALAAHGLAGLDDGTLPQDGPGLREQLIGVLEMVTGELGIRLPYDRFAGPLPAGYRSAPYTFHPAHPDD
ncbi:hypothetical protein GCM10010174_07090 [Kutzneria viridogrisea]|uniref:Uncharacterized protein n=1 Tax=Kutzneria viridogrisea TaxID=47990 RepID=A0ABR6BVI3_9PSEU|nr:hypothetical protein [Kutzneria viridogrisea]